MKLPRPLRDIDTINQLLTGCEREARRLGDAVPGAEHLLLSALDLPDGTARRAFELAGADPDQYRAAISTTHADALRAIGISADDGAAAPASVPCPATPATGVFRSNASGQQAFAAAVKLSKATRPAGLLGAHVVVAVCQMERSTAARALETMGIDRAALSAAASAELGTQR